MVIRTATLQRKRQPFQAAFFNSKPGPSYELERYELEPVQEPSVHAHVVLVAGAVKPEDHPVELYRTENQPAFSEVRSATEHHRHPAIAEGAGSRVGAAKQSVRIGREAALVSRNYGTNGVSIEIRAGMIHAAEISSRAQPASDVHVRSCVPAACVPSTIGAGELVAAINFGPRSLLSHS